MIIFNLIGNPTGDWVFEDLLSFFTHISP